MYKVILVNCGNTFYLRGTTWSFSADRADCFKNLEDTYPAISKAKQFMKKSLCTKISIVHGHIENTAISNV